MSLTINKNLMSLIIGKNLISFDRFTIFDRRISIKTIVILLNFSSEMSNINVALLSTTSTRKKLDKLTQAFELSFLSIKKTQKFKSIS
jgi:hypothetical protein